MMQGLRRSSRPLFFMAALALAAPVGAQDPIRPWLEWRTLRTPTHQFHFRAELEDWTRHVASRVEAVDSLLGVLVGFSPEHPVHIVVDDPFGVPNGYALPLIDRPATVWWAYPPDPRNDIGNFNTWGELLAVHELAHLAHLTRPSRNAFQRRLWETLSANIGPIVRRAPRWVYEGYATVLEGQITGSGRPNNVWRPAILRQWAVEGRLPTYEQLNGSDAFVGGEFAYLGGSAFLEWLSAREGDSALVHLWRRMTARRVRTFHEAFTGVFGDSPAVLYGLHTAELTRDAMAAVEALRDSGLVEGELVQRLTWETGDPAISPDGRRVAITLREPNRPGRTVVWNTATPPPDTAAIRKAVEALIKDPQDVTDGQFYPREREAQATLLARNGRSFQQPRWFPDNRTLVVTRWTPRADGSTGPELYLWDTETDGVRQLTRSAGALHPDPAPDASEVVAMRCAAGHCDIARVDVATGALTTLLEGDPATTYYRPRYSPDGRRIVASVSAQGRWRIVIADRDGRNARIMGPDDGANRYDASWFLGDTLVVVSERGGIANLELLPLDSDSAIALTRVTGAAVAPDVNRNDRSIWFLDLHARGYDVRRLDPATRAATVLPVRAEAFGLAGTRGTHPGMPVARNFVSESRPYGIGPRHSRWLPGAYASSEGVGGFLTVFSGDIVGRYGVTVTGAYGEPGTWQGGSVRSAFRVFRPTIEMGALGIIHQPSRSGIAVAAADSLDVNLVQPALAISGQHLGDGWLARGRLGGSVGRVGIERTGASYTRSLAFAELEFQLQQHRGAQGLLERFRVHTTSGESRGAFQRTVGSIELATVGSDLVPIEVGATVGAITGNPLPFEHFAIGGIAPPVGDSSLLSQRYYLPMLPTAIATGTGLVAWRAALPSAGWTLYFEGASAVTADVLDIKNFTRWHRALGVEVRVTLPPVPVLYTPGVQARAGVAYTLDVPYRRTARGYLSMRMEP